MKPGDTFVWAARNTIDHLYIIVSDPAKDGGRFVAFNLTSSSGGRQWLTLKKGDHPYIRKDSDVNFGDAFRSNVAEIQKHVASGDAKPHDPMDMAIVKAMLESGILPDFIVVDGKEGGTGAAPVEFTDHLGAPLREGLLFVHNTLVGVNLRDKIRLGASGKIISAFDMTSIFAIGADWVNCARGFMFAIGCIQSQSCHTNRCPTGVATQDKVRQRALVVPDKAERVHNFHRNTLQALAEMLALIAGHPASCPRAPRSSGTARWPRREYGSRCTG